MKHTIYDKNGNAKCICNSLEYTGKMMSQSYVMVSVKSPVPIYFEIGDYLDYRGIRYTINYDPSADKTSSANSAGDAFTYNNLKLSGPEDDLTRVRFLDFVSDDGSPTGSNTLHYSNSPKWTLFCEDLRSFVEKLQVNIDRVYNNWKVEISEYDFEFAHNVVIEVDNQSVWDALSLIDSKFKTCFSVSQRVISGKRWNIITIGDETTIDYDVLTYGKGNGLTKIEKSSNSDQQLINRLRAYGSTKNLPSNYYSEEYEPWYTFEDAVDVGHNVSDDDFVVKYNIPTLPFFPMSVTDNTMYPVVFIHEGRPDLKFETEIRSNYGEVTEIKDRKWYCSIVYENPEQYNELKSRRLIVISGFLKSDMLTQKKRWYSPYPLAPSSMSIKNLMLPSFLDYYAELDGETYILNKFKTQRVEDLNGNVLKLLYPYGEDGQKEYTPLYYRNDDGSIKLDEYGHYFVRLLFDPYIEDSENIEENGIREGCIFFDTEDEEEETEEIFPTIQGVTADEVRNAGYDITLRPNDNGKLDQVLTGTWSEDTGNPIDIPSDWQWITDDGKVLNKDEEDNPDNFFIEIKDIGFDIKEHLSADGGATIKFESGMCGGREFELVDASAYPMRTTHTEDGKIYYAWKVWLKRTLDETLDMYFPNKDYQIKSGDEFILLNLEMPRMYIDAASQRLKTAAEEYLDKNKVSEINYIPTLDKIFLARDYEKNGENSLFYKIKEGCIIKFKDDDLKFSVSPTETKLFIDTLSIKESPDKLPEVSISLKKEKEYSTIQKIQNEIYNIRTGVYSGVSASQSKAIAMTVGDDRYVFKKKDDTVEGQLTFTKKQKLSEGFSSPNFVSEVSGTGLWFDETTGWHFESDYIHARKKFTAKEVEIQEVKSIGGQQILTASNCTLDKVDVLDGKFRCYFRRVNGDGVEISNQWQLYDQAYTNTFNLEAQSDGSIGNHYFWRVVVGVGSGGVSSDGTDMSDYHWIDLSNLQNDPALSLFDNTAGYEGDEPKEGDKLIQLGNRAAVDGRTSAIIQAGSGSGSPYIREFARITEFSLGSIDTQLKPGDNRFTGRVNITGGIGAANLEDLPQEISNAVKIGAENLLINTGFDGNYESEDLSEVGIEGDTETYNYKMYGWEVSKSESVQSDEAISGYACRISNGGYIEQEVETYSGNEYIVSWKCNNPIYAIVGDKYYNLGQVGKWSECQFPVKNTGGKVKVRFFNPTYDSVDICDVKFERGTIKTDWCPSQKDTDKAAGLYKDLWYLQRALHEGSTDILGGLILSSIVKLGNYREGIMTEETAGISGIMNDGNDVSLWSGGSYEDAVRSINKVKSDINMSDSEWQELVGMVATHGGDMFLKGYIYALGGVFRGTVYARNGVFNGIVNATGGKFSGTIEAQDGVFRGCYKSVIAEITPESYKSYTKGFYEDGDITMGLLDWEKTGYVIRLSGHHVNWWTGKPIPEGATLTLMVELPKIVAGMSRIDKDYVRTLNLNRILVYNETDNLAIRFATYNWEDGNITRNYTTVSPNKWAKFKGDIFNSVRSSKDGTYAETLIWEASVFDRDPTDVEQ